MEIHEVCNIFPMMSADEFAGLKGDIEANGQREPVWTYQGKVIDGRNRLRACQELGLEPTIREWSGTGSLVEFVVSLNLHRRHLTSGQRAACGTEIEERLAEEAKARQRAAGGNRGNQHTKVAASPVPSSPVAVVQRIAQPPEPKSRDTAAKLVGSNRQYIQDAKTVKAKAPELHERVKAGTMTLPQAKREVIRTERREELIIKAAAAPQSDDWKVVDGSCVAVLPTLRPCSARLIFADPPYNINWDYGDGGHDDNMRAVDYLELCRVFIKASVRVLTEDGSLWVLINHEWAARFELMLMDAGFVVIDWITWYESFGVNCTGKFNRCSRRLFHAVKNPKDYVFNPESVTRPSDRQLKYNDKRADPGGKLWDDVWGVNPPIPRLTGTCRERLPDASNQLPLALLSPIVACASDPGDLVIDPFCGSGSMGEAAIRLGRRFLGIEKVPRYAELSRLRLSAVKGELCEDDSDEDPEEGEDP